MPLPALFPVLHRQHGCVTREQALQVMSRRQLEHLVKKGLLERCQPSVFRLAAQAESWEQRCAAATLSIPGSVASHRTAARLWGLQTVSSARVEVTAPRGPAERRAGVTLHFSRQLNGYTGTRNGIPITTVARTLVDLSSCLSRNGLARALDEACNIKLVTLAEVNRCLDTMETRGRRKISRLREELGNRDVNDERLESFLERRVLTVIRDAGLPQPSAQHRVLVNGNAYRLDLAYPELKIAVEPDGPHHLQPVVAESDRRRDADLMLAGWLVVHVGPDMDERHLVQTLSAAMVNRKAAD